MRYAVKLCYLGTKYHGWQIQPHSISVQEILQKCLSTVLRGNIEVVASGRTDAGVHASEQVCHFDLDQIINEKEMAKVNKLLPKDIALLSFAQVSDDFHARFDAQKRAYIYYINQIKNPYKQGQSYFYTKTLNLDAMNTACKHLIGNQDFETFSKVKTEVNTFMCTISEAFFIQKQDNIEFHVSSNRFLRGMVRALVGTLLEVGLERKNSDWIKEIIAQKDRCQAGRNVPANGLFLCSVSYSYAINWQKIN